MLSVCRIDERLVHGQVAVKWTAVFDITNIVIVDDGVANNSMLKNINVNLAPRGCVVQVLTVEESYPVLKSEHESAPTRTLVVAKTPGVFLNLVESGLRIKKLIVGNMGYSSGREKLTKNLFATPAEAEELLKLNALGVELVAQIVPDDRDKEIVSTLNKIAQIK
ncbi:MAG TPA: PTS sugar transporter subunit IIB [Anaerovoracaceae bacterium]|nr:PTS sugar transporter subunit IIB [Anaerovoracaceae bacterium]